MEDECYPVYVGITFIWNSYIGEMLCYESGQIKPLRLTYSKLSDKNMMSHTVSHIPRKISSMCT